MLRKYYNKLKNIASYVTECLWNIYGKVTAKNIPRPVFLRDTEEYENKKILTFCGGNPG
jgi:hypothetical protein